MNPYENLQPANIGNALMQGFQQGQTQARERAVDNALAQYALNPGAEEALQGVIKADPRLGIQLRQQQMQQQQALLEQHREKIIKGAQIVRQFGVKDQASWDAARQMAAQIGIDLSDVPAEYNQQYIQGLVSIADTFAPPKQNTQPPNVEEYQFAKNQGFTGSYMDFLESKRGPIVANNGDGTFTIVPRQMLGQQQQAGGIPPLPPGFVIDNDGGQTDSTPSGGF